MDEKLTDGSEPYVVRPWVAPLSIIVVVLLGYGIAPTRLPLKGEETCRARHGIEMVETGDWIVATNQFHKILDRPPLQYWTFAIIHKWIHELDPLTVRLSMAAITLLTSLMIWWYARSFLTETAALLAGVAYPTMGHVFDLGRRGETDGLFTLLMAASLMVWHYAYMQRWRAVWMWSAACFVAALATLTKGTQAPVAFFGAIYLFLLLRRDWRCLFNRSHLIGIALFVSVIAVWQVPFLLREGIEGTRMTWFDPFSARVGVDILGLGYHLLSFPFVVLGATLPWSVLVLGTLYPAFWGSEEREKSAVLFMLICMASIFVPVWVSQGGHQRYVMAMYPCMAVVIGAVAQRSLSLEMTYSLRRNWYYFVRVMAVVLASIAAGFLIATVASEFTDVMWIQRLSQPWWLMAVMVFGGLAGVVILFQRCSSNRSQQVIVAVQTIAVLTAISFNGAIVNSMAHNKVDASRDVADLRDQLPDGARLVSFGLLHHRFVYYYKQRIPVVDRPQSMDDAPEYLEYFAMDVPRGESVDLPFSWRQVARLNMDDVQSENPEVTVIVGQRIPVQAMR